jgi:DNA-binding NtrC family response regulator
MFALEMAKHEDQLESGRCGVIDFEKWQKDRQTQGTFQHTVRALYQSGLNYKDAMEMFRVCFLAEAIIDCHGNMTLAAEELQVDLMTIWNRLKKSGFSVKAIRNMPKEPSVGGKQ